MRTTYTSSNHRTAGNLLKDILLFPVKLVLRVIELALFILLAVILALIILSVSRSSQAMTLSDAHGRSYNEFVQEREESLGPYSSTVNEAHKIAWPILKSVLISFPASLSKLAPELDIERYFQNKTEFAYIEDRSPKSWSELPDLYWETFERASWLYLVLDHPTVPYPVGN
jgi:hypothetical protein